ncbi:hypothetical protein BLS_004116 [Venturia inaequalis]|uniref:C3H1-type domain-containing protein n=1 Tax=Venturia inaequalis TaxID=5025 RepID=A0A8H3V6T0_VENIN|nr:hypothetical protein BLS_004116 [Venturia inaequalis]
MSETTSPTTNGTNRLPESDPVTEAWARYDDLKTVENEKDNFIKEILWRYEFLIKQNNEIAVELARAKHFATPSSTRELKQQMAEYRKALERDPFVLVLVDADGMLFHDDLVSDGAYGGKKAAKMLEESVNIYVHELLADLPDSTKIVARFYANVEGLAETCCKAGIVTSPQVKKDFVKGFTQGRTLFDFVDVGSGKDRADEKIIETFKLHAHDYHCRHIILGCSHDNGFVRLLENYVFDDFVFPRLTLLEGVPFEKEFDTVPFTRSKFGTLFRNQKIVLPSTLPPWAVLGSDFIPARNENLTPSDSVASADASFNGPLLTWASKAKAAAAMPETPPPVKAVLAAPGPPGIPRNRKGQRVDAGCPFDKAEVDRVRKLKMCNVHYLRHECPYGDKCTHKHDRSPTKSDLETLRVVARMAACRNGSACDDTKCIYGHRCQAPPRLDKTKWSNADGGKTSSFSLPLLPVKRAVPGPICSQLLNLPAEILEKIASDLEDELLDFRLCCRDVQQKTWRLFKERYFALRQVWMERHSLETLAAISKYEPLASAVRKIVVATHYFPVITLEEFEEAHFRRDTDAFTRRELVTDQTTILAGGFVTLTLANAFPRFPNLKHLRFGEAYKFVKPPSYAPVDWYIVRTNYLSNSMVKFYSKNKIYPSKGLDWNGPSHVEIEDVITSIWLVVLTAISQGGLHLESFKVKRCLGINVDCVSSCTTALNHAIRSSCGDTLQTLRLRILGPADIEDDDLIKWDSCFPIFLANFPNLVDLTLDCNPIGGQDITIFARAIHDLPVFTKLRNLTLAFAHVNYAHLLEYLGKHKTLEKLELCAVVLLAASPDQSAWTRFLTALPKILDLQRLEVSTPQQIRELERLGPDERVDFEMVGWDKEAPDRKFILEQPDLGDKLKRAVKSIVVRESRGSSDYRVSWNDDDSTYDSDSEYGVANDISWSDAL